ncbi:PA2778 family cysteine peptidase [Amphritea balenae]|nr:PA2778 family cysteine peptidase [Amphritea balenae]GGK75203.1 hypothetical protein GCM10007941_26630 [Amphritea balenae]
MMLNQLSSETQLQGTAELQGLAYFPQEEDQCGPASLATMLAFNGISVTPEQLKPQLYIPGKGGTLQVELVARTRQYGLIPYQIKPELSELLKELDVGHPVLVMQNLGYSWMPQWHFAIAFGYDLKQQVLLLRSGPDRRYSTDLTLFVKTWQRADNWALVILPPDKLPASAEIFRYMQAASPLEQLGLQEPARIAYQSAAERWPDSATPQMGLGNISYARQQYRLATTHFSRYIKHSATPAPGWNNLAYALNGVGCPEAALKAIRCALSIAPGNPVYKESLQELSETLTDNSTDHRCPIPECIGTD